MTSAEESLQLTTRDGWTAGHNPWSIALVATIATFMEVLDTSIANVSLPHIAGNLSVSTDESTWVLTSYLVSNAIVLPISGWLSTRFGRKRFYMTCVALFTISSFLCGIAPNLGLLVFFRVLQGIGGGGLAPTEQSILADTFPPRRRGMAFAVYGMAVVLAPAVGPTLGGFITDHYSWRWVFFINVPVGLLSMLLSARVLTDPPHLTAARFKLGGIDTIGLGLIAVGLGALEIVLDKGQESDWFASNSIVLFTVIAAVALTAFVVWEWRHEHPVVEVRLFKNGNFAVANVLMLVLGMILFGSTVLLPQFTQILMGWSAQDAGLALSPGGMTVMLCMPAVGFLVSRVDTRYLIAFGFGVSAIALYHMARTLHPGIDFSTAMWLRIYQASGLAFLFVPINALVFNGVPPNKNNAVSGIVNLSRNMGGDVGIALVTTLIARRAQVHQANLTAHIPAGDPTLAARLAQATAALQHAGLASAQAGKAALGLVYRQVLQQAATLAYLDVLVVLAVFAGLMVPLVLMTRKTQPGKAAMAH